MALLPIVIYPDERLKQRCAPVSEITNEIRQLLDDMAETMYDAPGIGLAAPQVGALVRAIVVDVGNDEETEDGSAPKNRNLYKLINPEIIARSGTTEYEEGCLSIPDIREWVKRSAAVTVEALDESGTKVRLEADGLLAICLQHEIDHIDGVLFIDRISPLKRRLLNKPLLALRQKQGVE